MITVAGVIISSPTQCLPVLSIIPLPHLWRKCPETWAWKDQKQKKPTDPQCSKDANRNWLCYGKRPTTAAYNLQNGMHRTITIYTLAIKLEQNMAGLQFFYINLVSNHPHGMISEKTRPVNMRCQGSKLKDLLLATPESINCNNRHDIC